jgi:hypothetical protein
MTDETNTNGARESGDVQKPAASTRQTTPARSSSLEEFSEILHALDDKGGDDAAQVGDESQAGDEKKPGKPKQPKNVGELAKALGVDEKSLYGIEVPSSRAGEKPYTLGQLKDLMRERDDFATASLKLDEERRTHERDKVNAQAELQEMLAALPADSLKPEAVAKVRAVLERKRGLARAGIVENIPEWSDPVVRESELKAITEHLSGYGIPASFLLANLDHGVMRMVRDAQKLDEKVRRALKTVEERRGKPLGTGRKSAAGGKTESRKAPAGRVEREVASFRDSFSDRKH